MRLPFELRIALRYLLAQRRQLFISVISTISTLGVVVGVALLLWALALMTGVQGELRSRILGAASHLSIYRDDGLAFEDYRGVIDVLESLDGIEGAAPVLYGKALVSSGAGSGLVTYKGIDPALETAVTDFGETMVSGDLLDLSAEGDEGAADGIPPVVLGDGLAIQLQVFLGDTVKITAPEGHLGPFGMLPKTKNFRVAGTFHLGLSEFDNSFALLDLPDAQRLLGVGDEVMYVETKVTDVYGVEETEIAARTALGRGYGSRNWKEANSSLYSAFWLEKMATSLFVSFIIGVAALNIVATEIMIVMNKTRDIAILRSMGASPKSVMSIFMLQGAIIGVIGTAVGAVLGVSVPWILDRYRVISVPEDVYQMAYVPFKLLWSDFTLVVLAGPLICFLATLYPARRAARLVITEALRFE